MINAEAIDSALSHVFKTTQDRDGACVTTHCIYPSGELVRVKVYGGQESFVVSDEGRGIGDVEATGVQVENPDGAIRSVLLDYGLTSDQGIIRSRQVNLELLPLAIASVANGSRDAAAWLFNRLRLSPKRDFKALLRDMLEIRFPANVHAGRIVGNSNKPHTFESIISVESKQIIIDPVIRDAAAINARVVANMDVRSANIPNLIQRIVFDDADDGWGAAELNLLQMGATAVPYSRLHAVLPRLAQPELVH